MNGTQLISQIYLYYFYLIITLHNHKELMFGPATE